MNLSLLAALATIGVATAFRSSNAPQLQPHLQHETNSNNVEFFSLAGAKTPNYSSSLHNMVAIRSPFSRGAFYSQDETADDVDFVVDRDFSVASTLLVVGLWLTLFGPSNYSEVDTLGGIFHILFGAFIGKQTMKTRAVFTKDSFELRQVSNKYLGLEEDKALIPKQRKNFVAGTDNKWKYKSFVNWDFFPSIDLPILVYFKETQTPKEMQVKGSIGFRQMDRRDNGQMHWFPAFCNVKSLREQFEAHGCQKIGPVHGEEFQKK